MEICIHCHQPKATLNCDGCTEFICKKCLVRFSDEAFSLSEKREALGTLFCPTCYDEKIVPKIEEYNQILERAKEVGIWSTKYRGHIPILSKGTKEIHLDNVKDKKELLLQMGFRAVELGFNGIIHVDIAYKKVRDHGYQKMLWSGKGLPVHIDQEKLDRLITYESSEW